MRKLASVYGGILVIIVLFVATCMVSCGPARSGQKEYKPEVVKVDPADSIQYIRALNLQDSSIAPLRVLRKENVYKIGDKVWVLSGNMKIDKTFSSSMPSSVTYGHYSKYKILNVN